MNFVYYYLTFVDTKETNLKSIIIDKDITYAIVPLCLLTLKKNILRSLDT